MDKALNYLALARKGGLAELGEDTMYTYLAETAELFRGHEVLRDWAETEGVRIINRSRGSMIDAYEREPMP